MAPQYSLLSSKKNLIYVTVHIYLFYLVVRQTTYYNWLVICIFNIDRLRGLKLATLSELEVRIGVR